MAHRRFCHFCLQPYQGGGDHSNCTQVCPSRRGYRRGYVTDELVHGHMMQWVHPRSQLISQAQAILMLNDQTAAGDIQALRDQVAELENRIHLLEQWRHEMRTILRRLQIYRQAGHDPNQRINSSQPESEPPGAHDE